VRRRSLFLALLLVALTAAGVLGGLAVLLKQVPDYYTAASDETADDEKVAGEVLTRIGDLKNDIRSREEWGASFTAAELNAFLRQNLTEGDWMAGLLPGHLHDPRVAIDGDRVKFAARYGEGFWSSVVSIELRAWLVDQKVNTLAVELVAVRAGAVPFGSQSLLDFISESARDSNVDVTWYRHDGHAVGLFRFYADQRRPATHIQTVKVADGAVTVAGHSTVESVIPVAPIGIAEGE
jgi:hypothetical protein